MNKEIYQKNMCALQKKYPAWANLLQKKQKKRNFDVIVKKSLLEDPILIVKKYDKILYLNGKYAPEAVVENWLRQQGKIEEYAPIVVMGISNGKHIKRIMEVAPKTSNILIYEPSLELFRREMEEVDLSFLFALDIPVGIIVDGLNESELQAYFNLMISYDI